MSEAPSPGSSAGQAPHLQGLNPEQLRAVTFPGDRPLLVLAGPGTGKTTVLAARHVHLVLGTPGAELDAVLAVTFTNRAAEEMRARISRLLEAAGRGRAARAALGAQTGTFHWLAASLLRQYPVAAGVDPEFGVLDRASSRLMFARAAARALSEPGSYPLAPLMRRDFVDEAYRLVMRLKDSLVGPDEFLEPALAGAAAPPGGEGAGGLERDTARVVHLLYRAYEAELERRGALDFPGLIGRACALLSAPGTGARLRRRFCYILVDEFQDTNLAQLRLLRLLAADERLSNVTAVGDPRQAIYAWRNARVENLFDFRAREWGGDVVELVRNYRSRPGVLEAAGRALVSGASPWHRGGAAWPASGAASRSPVEAACPDLQPTRPPAPARPGQPAPLALAALPDEAAEAEAVAGHIERLLEAGESPDEVAVLMRGTAPAVWIEEALRRRGRPCRTVGGAAGRELEGLQDLLALLRLAHDPHDGPALCRVTTRLWGVPDAELADFCRAAGPQARARAPGPVLLEPGAGTARVLWPWAQEALDLLLDLGAAARELSLVGLVEWAARRLGGEAGRRGGLPATREGVPATHQRAPAAGRPQEALDPHQLQQIAALARSFETANPGAGLGDFLAYLGYFLQESQLEPEWSLAPGDQAAAPGGAGRGGPRSSGQVLILTVHQAKGLEFDHVVVAGVRPGRFPLKHRSPLLDFWPLPPGGGAGTSAAPEGAGGAAREEAVDAAPVGAPGAGRGSEALGPGLIVRADADGAHTRRYEAHRARLEGERAAEERRLFYVALTRARESLLVTRPQPLPPQPGRGDDYFAELVAGFPEAVAAASLQAVAAAPPDEAPAPKTAAPPGEALVLQAAEAAPTGAGPVRLGPVSFSQIAAYRRCPLLCWLRYVARLPAAPAPAPAPAAAPAPDPLLLGSLVHAAIRVLLDQGLWPGRGAAPAPGELDGLLARLAGAGGPPGLAPAGPGSTLAEARRLLESLWTGPLAGLDPWPGGVELELSWTWAGRGTRMVAVVDCVARSARGPLLLDFKASGGLPAAAMEEYGHQLRFYRMGLGALEPALAAAGLAVYHLPAGRLVPVDGSEAGVEATRRVVEEAMEGMGAGRFGPDPACRAGAGRACAYRGLCPFGAAPPGEGLAGAAGAGEEPGDWEV